MTSTSNKIRVYTDGVVDKGIGAYAYIVLEYADCGDVKIGEGKGRLFAPSLLRARFAQAGKSDDDWRMKMRAIYEGVRHCPDGSELEVYTENYILASNLESTTANGSNEDIAEKYRQYVAEHHIKPVFITTKYYTEDDLPSNDHDEWTWYAHWLCENEIKKYRKKNK